MDCLVLEAWDGELELARRAVPTAGITDVLVEVHAASVGRTVANAVRGDLGTDPGNLPRIPGHELVGTVIECGDGVTSLEAGDLIASYTYLVCDHCAACLRGDHPLCENLDGFLGVDRDGGYAEFVSLPARYALQLPAGIDPVDATVVPDAVATPYHVMNQRVDAEPGDELAVLGAGGGVGIHLVQLAAHYGCTVTAVDLDEEKLARCRAVGAARSIDTSAHSLAAAAASQELTFDAVVDFTGDIGLIEDALERLGPRGRLVNLTTFPERTIRVSPRAQVFGEHEVVGSRSFSKYELVAGADLVADGVIEPVITETTDLAGVPDLLAAIQSNQVVGRGAVVL